MKSIKLFLIVAAVAAAGCATPVKKMVQNPSGKPEINIGSPDVGRIKSLIIGDMVDHGYTIESDTAYSLTLSRRLQGGEEFMASLLVGNSYSTNSRSASYTFVPEPDMTRVLVTTAVRAQMPGGQMKSVSLDDNATVFNVFQQQLLDIRDKVEERQKRPDAQTAPQAAAAP